MVTCAFLSINPSLSPPSFSTATQSSFSSAFCHSPSPAFLRFPSYHSSRTKPSSLYGQGVCFCYSERSRGLRESRKLELKASNMTITEVEQEEDEEGPPPYVDSEINSRPRRIALFVEPSPFAYVSGYKNRFQNFIRYLREMGDEVMVVTTHEGVPDEFYGAKLIGSRSFPCPWYQKVPLSLALSPRIISEVAQFKPDIIHASSPGIMIYPTIHLQLAGETYVVEFLHRAADLTLVPSAAISKDLLEAGVAAANTIRLWNKGVDSESFHPRFRSHEMRLRLSNGEPEKPLIVHVGRLGVEKSLDFLKSVMDRLPEARIAFVGDGPYREDLEKLFSGMPASSQAYASGDVFVMPSESETLGLVVLEAMSSGIPVVGARAGGIPDIIPADQEGKTGFLYDYGDVDDCLRKLQPLLENKELRETIGKAAREEMEKYDWKAATRVIRNEQYNAAIWFWRKKRAQFLRPLQWFMKRIFPPSPPEIKCR
ncbi:sulfoquinovosyldiacylglycerol 2 [Prunus dulcis]|uniref:Sulfoquinovosyldiacylglycerol 2 n=1 Tax=Prunus dulcis TaxID=3755 RepID=A0A4Y1RQV9_PRUDU|nr:sulfoquinovosyldiacylglycerol 2 [Prunus dulcis]